MALSAIANLGYGFAARAISGITGMIVAAALARHGARDMGIYYFGRSVSACAGVALDLGLSRYAILTLGGARPASAARLSLLTSIRVATSLSGLVIVALVSSLVSADVERVVATVSLTAAGALASLADLLLDAFRSEADLRTPALVISTYRIVFTALALTGIVMGVGLPAVLGAGVGSGAVALLLAWSSVRRRVGWIRLGLRWNDLRTVLAETAPFSAVLLLAALNAQVVFWVLSVYSDATTLGLFAASSALIEAMLMVAFTANAAVFPTLVRGYQRSGRDGITIAAGYLRLSCAVASMVTISSWFLGDIAVRLVFGTAYQPTVVIFRIAVCAVLPIFLNSFCTGLLQATGHARTAAFLFVPLITGQLLLALFLVPSYGAAGAAGATVLAEWGALAMHLLAVRRVMPLSSVSRGLPDLVFTLAALAVSGTLSASASAPVRVAVIVASGAVAAAIRPPLRFRHLSWLREVPS